MKDHPKLTGIIVLAVLIGFAMAACGDANPASPKSQIPYTVTFNKNGGTTDALPQSKTVTPPATTVDQLPTPPMRAGYAFDKWTINQDGTGGKFTANTPVTASITVYAQWISNDGPKIFTISLTITGNVTGDSVSVSPDSGEAGDTITIDYTLANAENTNRLVFSGTQASIAAVATAGSGSKEYTVDEDDADEDGFIAIYAAFTHTNETIGAVESGDYRNLFVEFGGKTTSQVDTKVNAMWNQLFVSGTADQIIYYEVAPDMAYILDVNNNDVRSEGMSYGMMMAVQMNDQARFNRLWKWAHTYMYHDREVANTGKNVRGFFSWQVRTNGNAVDTGTAPDGEFYFVTALLFASARWGDGTGINEYGRKARHILYDMLHRDDRRVNPTGKDPYDAIPMFNPTYNVPEFTTVTAQHTDPSYILPAFYDVWAIEIEEGEDYWDIWPNQAAALADAARYRELATGGRNYLKGGVLNATTGLGPDYATYTGAPGSHGDFEYDAWRIAMNIGFDYAWWAADPWQITQSDRIQAFFESEGITTHGNRYRLNGTKLGSDHSPGLVGCNAVASLAASNVARATAFVNHFWDISPTTGTYRYYDGCLYMMGLLHLSGRFKAYFPTNRVKSAQITPATAIFDKNTAGAQYQNVVVTITLNGNTLSNIKNGNTDLVQGNSGTNGYTVSGNTATIRKEYLATLANGQVTLTFNFSAGQSRTIQITIGDTTGGGSISGGGTSYDFTTNPSVTPIINGSGVTATVTNGVLKVVKTSSNTTAHIALPFDLGTSKLGSFSTVRIVIKTVSGDVTYKTLTVQACAGSTWTGAANIATMSTGQPFTVGTKNLTNTATNQSAVPGSLSGEILIGFSFGQTNSYDIEITSIELIQ